MWRYLLEQVWHPRVCIANETASVIRKLPHRVGIEADGTLTYRQRYAGTFTQPLRLQSFPFDRQTFRIQLVAVRYRPRPAFYRRYPHSLAEHDYSFGLAIVFLLLAIAALGVRLVSS